MRPFTLFLMSACLCAADPIPLVELEWGGGLHLPEPIAGWWVQGLREAGPWLGEGVDVVALAAVGNAVHLRGVVLQSGDSATSVRLTRASARWFEAAAAAATVAAVMPDWPSMRSRIDGADLLIGDDSVPTLPASSVPAGLRTVFYGSGLAEALLSHGGAVAAATPFGDSAPEPWIEPLRAALVGWSATASLLPTGPAFLETGLPASWFMPIDINVITAVPEDLVAVVAVAPDWATVMASPKAHALATSVLPDLPAVDQWGTGTWVAGLTAAGHWLLAIPGDAEPALLRAMVPLSVDIEMDPTELKTVTSVSNDSEISLHLRFRDEHWWFSDEPSLLSAASIKSLPPMPFDTACWARVTPAGIAAALTWNAATIDPSQRRMSSLVRMLPLPVSLLWPEDPSRDVSWGVPAWSVLNTAPWTSQEAVGRGVAGQLRFELAGNVLPYVAPGVAVTWGLDRIRECGEQARLKKFMEQQVKSGEQMTSIHLMRDVVAPEAMESARLVAAMQGFSTTVRERMGEVAQHDEVTFSWKKLAAERGLPLIATTAEERAALREAHIALEVAEEQLPHPELAWIACRRSWRDGQSPFAQNTSYVTVARYLQRAGLTLLAFKDPRGVRAMAVADAMLPPFDQRTLQEGLTFLSMRSQMNQARVLAAAGGVLPVDHPLMRPLAPSATLSWIAERALLGDFAEYDPAVVRLWHAGQQEPWWQAIVPGEFGWSVYDLRQQLTAYGTGPSAEAARLQTARSVLRRAVTIATGMIDRTHYRNALEKEVADLIVDILLLPVPLPTNAEDLSVRLGRPLVCAGGELSMQMVYEALPTGGFTLRFDASGERPGSVTEPVWRTWQQVVPDNQAFVLKLHIGQFRWDPHHAAAAKAQNVDQESANDF